MIILLLFVKLTAIIRNRHEASLFFQPIILFSMLKETMVQDLIANICKLYNNYNSIFLTTFNVHPVETLQSIQTESNDIILSSWELLSMPLFDTDIITPAAGVPSMVSW